MTGPMYVHFIILVCMQVCQFVDPSQIVFTIGVGNNNDYWFFCKLCMQKYITLIVIRLTFTEFTELLSTTSLYTICSAIILRRDFCFQDIFFKKNNNSINFWINFNGISFWLNKILTAAKTRRIDFCFSIILIYLSLFAFA